MPLPGRSATAFALTDTWHTLKAKECHIIIDGHLWTGRFVVWRCPVKLTYDMEVWTATKPLPDFAKHIPDNCIICSRDCGGVVKLGDGDYDGDFIQISAWVELLDFMDNTPSEMDAPALKQARDDILASLPERMQPVGLWTLPETALFFLAVSVKVPGGFGASGGPVAPDVEDLQFDLEGEINMKCPLLVSLASDVYAMKALGQHRDGNVIMSSMSTLFNLDMLPELGLEAGAQDLDSSVFGTALHSKRHVWWIHDEADRCLPLPTWTSRLVELTVMAWVKAHNELDGIRDSCFKLSVQGKDILRNWANLAALGWLGRAYLSFDWLSWLGPQLFQLSPYDDGLTLQGFKVQLDDGTEEFEMTCTLKESSVLARGLPLCFNFRIKSGAARNESFSITGASLRRIGCDLLERSQRVEPVPCSMPASSLCDQINSKSDVKRLLVESLTETIFGPLAQVAEAAEAKAELESKQGGALGFSPRQEFWAREGSAEKWLECVNGYYFAEALVDVVGFVPGGGSGNQEALPDMSFLFYYDPTEPLNSENALMNVNPE
ncbi:unnamed protein product, partial [Symbiodinium sp. KB8]